MLTLLADANLDGQAELLDMRPSTDAWRELREYLELQLFHFEDVGLDRSENLLNKENYRGAGRLFLP